MKRTLILVIVLCLVIPSSLVVMASTNSSYAEAIINGVPLTSHEFLVYYITRATDMGISLEKSATVFDAGSMVSYKKAILTLGENNSIVIAAYMLPETLKKSDIEYLWLISFVAAFIDSPAYDDMNKKLNPGQHYLKVVPPIVDSAFSASRETMIVVGEYGFYCDNFDGRLTFNAEFVGRDRGK